MRTWLNRHVNANLGAPKLTKHQQQTVDLDTTSLSRYRDPCSFHIFRSSVCYKNTHALPNLISLSYTMILKSKYFEMKTFLNVGHDMKRTSHILIKLLVANQNALLTLPIVLR